MYPILPNVTEASFVLFGMRVPWTAVVSVFEGRRALEESQMSPELAGAQRGAGHLDLSV